jgi:hypothetical protein
MENKTTSDRPTGRKGHDDMRTISIDELKSTGVSTWSVKDDSPRGVKTKYTSEVNPGDKVVIDNYFTLVTE